MGIFSKFFTKKTRQFEEDKTDVSLKTEDTISNPSDFSKTIFLWNHDNVSCVREDDDYSRYFIHECDILNPSKYHAKLIEEGYFENASLSLILNSFKIDRLKEILSTNGLINIGKKDVLVERILSNVETYELKSIITENYFILSARGHEFIRSHFDYVLLHQHKYLNIKWQEYDNNFRSGFTFYDIVYGILNNRIRYDKQNFGRNEYLSMYRLLAEEEKREQALRMILRVLYIDVSGSCSMHYYKMFTKTQLLESFDAIIMLAPGIIKYIKEYKDIYSDMYVDDLYEFKLPIQICSKDFFVSMLHAIYDDRFDEKEYENKLKNLYRTFVQTL